MGPILAGRVKPLGSPEHLRDHEAGKRRAGATCLHQGFTLQ